MSFIENSAFLVGTQKKYGFAPLGGANGAVKQGIFGLNSARLYLPQLEGGRRSPDAGLFRGPAGSIEEGVRLRGEGAVEPALRLRPRRLTAAGLRPRLRRPRPPKSRSKNSLMRAMSESCAGFGGASFVHGVYACLGGKRFSKNILLSANGCARWPTSSVSISEPQHCNFPQRQMSRFH